MISSIEEIVDDIRRGQMVVLVDEESRENEGDLVLAAEKITPELVNFMIRHGRGLICVTLTKERCAQLGLTLMTRDNTAPMGTNFTVSVEAASGVSTGISAADRARTISILADPNAKPSDLVMPGHIFPVMAESGGVLVRAGHTEAGCDLTSLAGLFPAAVICEILKDDGEMARMPDLQKFSKTHGLKVGTIESLIDYRSRNESLIEEVEVVSDAFLRGDFRIRLFRDTVDKRTHVALVRGEITPEETTTVRVVTNPSVLDFFADFPGRSWGMEAVLAEVSKSRAGAIVLLGSDAPAPLDRTLSGHTVVDQPSVGQELRTYGIGAQILVFNRCREDAVALRPP